MISSSLVLVSQYSQSERPELFDFIFQSLGSFGRFAAFLVTVLRSTLPQSLLWIETDKG